MKQFLLKPKKFQFIDLMIWLIFLLYFRLAIVWIFKTFSDAAFYEYALGFILIVFIAGITLYKKRASFSKEFYFSPSFSPAFIVFFALIVDLINTALFHFNIVSAIAFLGGFYGLSGFYLKKSLWRRGIFLVLILIFTLPFLEYIQTFIGFPLRLLSAKVVSFLLQAMNINHISESTVIVTENNATSIDLPCSGVKSIYAGSLFLFTFYYLRNIGISWRSMLMSVLFLGALIFFNIWRIFSLVYIYDVLQMPQFGDAIHVSLGLIGFCLSCLLLCFLGQRYLPAGKKDSHTVESDLLENQVLSPSSSFLKIKGKVLLLVLCFLFLMGSESIIFLRTRTNLATSKVFPQKSYAFTVKDHLLKEIPFNNKERDFFVKREAEFSKKFQGKTKSGIPFSLVIVASKSWKSHHNPETCLEGLGYKLGPSGILQIGDIQLRKIELQEGKGEVFYWFKGKEKNLHDYSERIWEGLWNPQENWTLIEIGFDQSVNLQAGEIEELITALNDAAKIFQE